MSIISQSFINHMITTYVKSVIELLSTKHGFNKDEAYLAYIGNVKSTASASATEKLNTEDTGKQFEMAICLAFGITYNGTYKYGMEIPEKLKPRLTQLIDQNLFPMCKHTASKGARYDFTSSDDDSKHLSAKTTKKGGGKVAPQVIGQPSPQKFCDIVGLPFTTIENLKTDIQTKITTILPFLVDYTFDCSTLFYNKKKDTIRFIKMISPIVWDNHIFTWTCHANVWNNTSTLKIKNGDNYISLVEFQFHEKERTNMAIRWCYENVLTIFKDNFNITNL
jgi:hypothetical protein